MEDREIDQWVAISEYRINRWIGLLMLVWYTMQCGALVVIQFFIYQQERVPASIAGVSGLFPHLIIVVSGATVILMISERSRPKKIECFLVLGAIFICFVVSDWESGQVEHFIRNPEYKEMCYRIMTVLYNSSQLLLLPIWYGIRFLKQTPLIYTPKRYLVVYFGFLIVVWLSAPIFSNLRELGIMPINF